MASAFEAPPSAIQDERINCRADGSPLKECEALMTRIQPFSPGRYSDALSKKSRGSLLPHRRLVKRATRYSKIKFMATRNGEVSDKRSVPAILTNRADASET